MAGYPISLFLLFIMLQEDHIRLYFYSGTGNSYRVSQWIEDCAKLKNYSVSLIPIEKGKPTKSAKENDAITGIILPTHGFTAPWHVIKFAWNIPPGKGEKAFCVTTRAGVKLGGIYLPGISGSAPFLIAATLLLRGYVVMGIQSIDMPSNWFSLHPIPKQKNIDAIIKRAEPRLTSFMKKILSGKRVWYTRNTLYEGILGVALSPVSLGYLFFGRFFLAKLFFSNNRCNGCGVCSSLCPIGAITLKGKKNIPFWGYNCESCMRCAAVCPKNAVEAGHSWGILLYLIVSVPFGAYFLSLSTASPIANSQFLYHLSLHMLNLLYFYPALFLSYSLFILLLRIPAIRYFFTHTTMTHYWRRYNEPTTNISRMTKGMLEERGKE